MTEQLDFKKTDISSRQSVIDNGDPKFLLSSYVNRAQAKKDAGDYASSLKDIHILQDGEKYEDQASLAVFAAELYMREGMLETALKSVKQAISLNNTHKAEPSTAALVRYVYAVILTRNGQYYKAEQQANWILSFETPDHIREVIEPIGYFAKAATQILQGNYHQAIENADKARFTELKIIMFPLGAIAANKLKEYDLVIDILEEYSDQTPLHAGQKLVFKKLKAALKKVDDDPNLKTLTLPQDKEGKLAKLMDFSIKIENLVSTQVSTKVETKSMGFSFKLNY
ncbi:MAG: hypothetical protein JKX94_02585 [Sneathiella sp.]|nr:hypothetical protein [Sneathiella sp.]